MYFKNCGLYAEQPTTPCIYTGTNTILITVTISAEYIFFFQYAV